MKKYSTYCLTAFLAAAMLLAGCSDHTTDGGMIEEGADELYLQENAQRPGVVVTDSGLQYEVFSEGSGNQPGAASLVRFNYNAMLVNGVIFDSHSYRNGQDTPAEMNVSDIEIPGLVEGILLMREGAEYRFVIPGNIGFGEEERQELEGTVIHPNATLIFDVHLLEVDPEPDNDE